MANTENLKPFKPGQSGNPNGRPRKLLTILKDHGYSKDDIRQSFEHIGWNTTEDLEEILSDKTKPVILKLVARAFIKGSERGDFRFVSEILQHVIGKPKEQSENKHLHKIIVEYVNPNDIYVPPESETDHG